MTLAARDRLVFPLDVPDLASARDLLAQLSPHVGVFKVGLELFIASGPESVRAIGEAGAACFLDLKIHDISETMARAVRAASMWGVRYLTVHTSAGRTGLSRAREAVEGTGTQLLGVTVLTSLDDADLEEVGFASSAKDLAVRLGTLGVQSGLDGLVASPEECPALRRALGRNVRLVVPGIRPAGAERGDQKRVATPADAIGQGADLLVVGRPIRDAQDPASAAAAVVREIEASVAVTRR